jgi:hypothetical protein
MDRGLTVAGTPGANTGLEGGFDPDRPRKLAHAVILHDQPE